MNADLLPALVILQVVTAGLGYYFYRRLSARVEQTYQAQVDNALKESVVELLAELEASTQRAARGLSKQKDTLSRLLREADRRIQVLPDLSEHAAATAPGEQRPGAQGPAWRDTALHLAQQGLSEAAIARQLRVGIEEVHLALVARGVGA